MGRQPCCDKVGLKRGPWTIEEDHKLMNFILNNGIHCWRMVPKLAGLLRCGKSCRLRWINYLRPDLKRGAFTEEEEDEIIQLHSRLGNRWSKIASHFPGRTDNEIKNHWNTRIKKRLKLLGLDPVTHKPVDQSAEKAQDKVINESTTTTTNTPDSNSTKEEEKSSLDIESPDDDHDDCVVKQDNNIPAENKVQEEVELTMDETTSLLNNYELLCGNLETAGSLTFNQQTSNTTPSITTSNCSTNSSLFSWDESNNPSMAESSSLQEDSLQQWIDNVDSIWDCFNQLDGGLFLLEK